MDEFAVSLRPGLVLREVRAEDEDELFALVQANQPHLEPWMPWAAQPTIEDTRIYLAAALAQRERNDGFGAVVVADGAIIGSTGFHRIDWANRATSLGYWLAADSQGAGIMTAAVSAMVDHAFGPWGLHRVEIDAAVGNARSRAIPERLGFVEEGVRRGGERFGERFVDLVVYSMLAPDWRVR